jgi:hypothetical protein
MRESHKHRILALTRIITKGALILKEFDHAAIHAPDAQRHHLSGKC